MSFSLDSTLAPKFEARVYSSQSLGLDYTLASNLGARVVLTLLQPRLHISHDTYKLMCFDKNINGNSDVEFLECDYFLVQWCVKLILALHAIKAKKNGRFKRFRILGKKILSPRKPLLNFEFKILPDVSDFLIHSQTNPIEQSWHFV